MIYTEEIIKKKNNRKAKKNKIFKIISFPFIILIILIITMIGYQKFIKKDNDINIFGFRYYMVMTGSMEPNYNIGDVIIVKETPKENIKVGDIINYVSENGKDTVTHRVTKIIEKDGQTLYRTKGDNNNSEDAELVDFNRVQGVLIFKISKLGTLITKALTGTGMCIIVALIILSYLIESRKEEKRFSREEARKMYNVPKYEKEDV